MGEVHDFGDPGVASGVVLAGESHPDREPDAYAVQRVLQTIRDFLPCLGLRSRGDGVNRLSLRLPNGSRVVALPGGEKATRSYSKVSLVIIDEASMVPDPVHDSVSPTMATTNGDLLVVSTPMGKRGAFTGRGRMAAMTGSECWVRRVKPTPGRISAEFLAAERRIRGDHFMGRSTDANSSTGIRICSARKGCRVCFRKT